MDNQLVNTNTSTITLTNGHKYLTYVNGTWSYVNGTNQTLSVSGGTDMVIDLTQMFPFDTPTTLTDNRVQAIINRDYIPYNVGEIKNSVVSEITCTRLPKEYKEVEYIESHGTEYIDTGVLGNLNTEIVFDFKPISYSTNKTILLVGYSGNNIQPNLSLDDNVRTSRFGDKSFILRNVISLNNRYICKINKTALYLNGNNLGNFNTVNPFTTPDTMWVGICRGISNEYINGTNQIFSCQIYDNGTLVRDFVPCYRVSDNEIGLYDLVNGVFYTNQGTGTFAKGNDVSENGTLQLPAPLEIAGVNTAHNTFQITNNGYVFTRNVFERAYQSGDESLSNVLTDMTNTLYQLSTPQVINIPKKHLGCINLGSGTFTKEWNNRPERFTLSLSNIASQTGDVFNLWCSLYKNISTFSGDMEIALGANKVYFVNYACQNMTGSQFANAMSGVFLFYETTDEVADFNKEMNIQGGGYLNSDSQVLPNVEMLLKCK